MMHPLNIRSPASKSPNQIWENGICIGVQCETKYSPYGPVLQYITGRVMVGETYQTIFNGGGPGLDLFIRGVINDDTVETRDAKSGRMGRSSIDFLLNAYACRKLD